MTLLPLALLYNKLQNCLMIVVKLLLFCCSMAIPTCRSDLVTMNSSIDDYVETPRNLSTVLSLLAMVNYGGDSYPVGPLCTKAIQIALNQLAKNDSWLPGYSLRFNLFDDKCSMELPIQQTIKHLNSSTLPTNPLLPLSFISGCTSPMLIGSILKNYNHFGFTFATGETTATPITNGALFPLVYRDFDQDLSSIRLLHKFQWPRVALFSDNEAFFNSVTEKLLPILELNNITVLTISKPSHYSESVEEMEQEMKRLKRVEARIIICQSDSAIALSCWLHRFDMFGPEFVIIGSVWSEFEPETADIPEYISDWCTAEMLTEVIKSWIFVGQGSNNDLFGKSFTDSTGLSETAFLNELDSLVVDGSNNPNSDWASKCYDVALLMGTVIGEAENLIKSKLNSTVQTLANDPQQSPLLLSMIEDALFGVQVTGQKGIYNFEKSTNGNTGGYVPVLFYQKLYDPLEGKFNRRAVGYMATFEDGVKDLNGGFIFRTKTGQPPLGFAKVIVYQRPILQPIEYWAHVSISSLMIVAIIGLNVVNRIANPCRWKENALPSIGLILILCQSFANPNNQFANFTINCSAILLLDTIGFLTFWFGLQQKSERIAQKLSSEREKQMKGPVKLVGISIVPILIAISAMVCMIVAVSLGLFTQRIVAHEKYPSKIDKNIVYQPEFRFCSMKQTSDPIFQLFIAALAMTLLLFVQQIYKNYKNKMLCRRVIQRKRRKSSNVKKSLLEIRINLNGLVMILILLGAAILLALIQIDNTSWLHTLTTIVAFLFSLISSFIIFLPTFLNRKVTIHFDDQCRTSSTGRTSQKPGSSFSHTSLYLY